MKAAWTVYRKEVRENLRDRRTLTSALVTGPLLGPLVLAMMLNVMAKQMHDSLDKPLSVPVVGAENAPRLIGQLRQLGLVVEPAPADAEAAVRDERRDVVLEISPGYATSWDKGEPASVELLFDGSRHEGATAASRLRKLVLAAGAQTAALRLVARGLHPEIVRPIVVVDHDTSTALSRGARIFGMLPYLLVMTIFVGGMYLAIDTTAGERERQSLEPLFINPAPRWQILLGKLGATWTFAMLSLCLSLVAFAGIGPFLPIERLGMAIDVGPRFAVRVLVVMLPSIIMFGIVQTLVSAFAKSFREAQTYLSLLLLVPSVPSVLLSIAPMTPKLWMFAVPLVSQQFAITRFVRGEDVTTLQLALCCGGTLLFAALLAAATVRVYGSERLAIST
ncbi:MAG: ABC transporter permease [Polyangia bacterium]